MEHMDYEMKFDVRSRALILPFFPSDFHWKKLFFNIRNKYQIISINKLKYLKTHSKIFNKNKKNPTKKRLTLVFVRVSNETKTKQIFSHQNLLTCDMKMWIFLLFYFINTSQMKVLLASLQKIFNNYEDLIFYFSIAWRLDIFTMI